MLQKFTIENYRSFRDKCEFSIYANPRRTSYIEHVYNSEDLVFPVLKHSMVIGPTASGKTNMVSAMRFMKAFGSGQLHHDPKDEYLRHWYYENRFSLPAMEDETPIHFMIEFSKAGRSYAYSVSFDGEGIKNEALYLLRGNRTRPQVIFLRTRDRIEFQRDLEISRECISLFMQQMEYSPETSVLVLNANLRYVDNDDMCNAQNWFHENLEVADGNMSIPELLDFYCDKPRTLQFTNTLLEKIGVGCTLAIAESKPSEWLARNARTMDRSILNLFENGEISPSVHSYETDRMVIRTVGRRKVIRELEFVHTGAEGFELRTDASRESAGTIRLLTVFAVLYRTIYEGKISVMDDMDMNINAATFRDLMKFYCETEGCGQILYTTNNLITMNQQEMVRLDEVNLLEKKDGATRNNALDGFPNIKTMLSLERNYLDGRFGGRSGTFSTEDIDL